ncbi:hypothetical protein ACIRD6_37630, partial [Streptomyces sp. NPDC102473]
PAFRSSQIQRHKLRSRTSHATTIGELLTQDTTERIGELRQHKNMTAHLDQLMAFIPTGPTKDRLNSWTEVRKYLP